MPRKRVFLSYAHADSAALALRLRTDLCEGGFDVWLDENRLQAGSSWSNEIEENIDACHAVVALLSDGSFGSEICRGEHLRALRRGKRVIPVLIEPGADRPVYLEAAQYLAFGGAYDDTLTALVRAIEGGETATLPPDYVTTHLTVPPLPRHFVPRAAELERLRQFVIADHSERQIALTAVRAMGGIGKTVLAQALCQDQAVHDAYPNGVIWATIGQSPNDAQLISQMREIAKALGDEITFYDTLAACSNRFRTILQRKAALIVLDDVWSARDLHPFVADAPQSRLLVTTRQREVVKATGGREFCLDVLEQSQARQLLAESSDTEVAKLPPEAAGIIEECGFLPLAISMIGALVRGESSEAWGRALRRLKQSDLEKIRLQFPDYLYPNLFRAIEVSVDSLDANSRSKYLDFAVFEPDISVPSAVFECFWGLDSDSAADIIDAWVAASLANRRDSGVTIHDLQMDYVRKLAPDRKELHRRLVNGYRGRFRDGWASGPDDGYYFTWLVHHLTQAGESEERDRLLLDPRWMRAKLARKGIADLLADYSHGLHDPDSELVADALRLSGHVLSKYPEALTSQLTGRLLSTPSPAIHKLLDDCRRGERPWIKAIHQTLKQAGGPLLRTLEGHAGGVTAIAMTPDGRRAVSASGDRRLKIWDLQRGEAIRTLKGHTDRVNAVALTPDGKRAISGSDSDWLKMWDVDSGEAIRTLKTRAMTVKMTPDGKRAVSGSRHGTLKVWDLEKGEAIRTWEGHSGAVNSVALTPNGKWAVSGSWDQTLKGWDLESGELICTLEGHTGSVNAVAVTPDGKWAVSGSSDASLMLWDLERREAICTLDGHIDWVRAVAVTPDGKRAVSGSDDKTLKVWDLERRELIRTLEGHAGCVNDVAVTPDGKRAVSGSDDNTLKVWDLERAEAIRMLEGHADSIWAVAVTPNGKRAVSASSDQTVKVWDLERAEAIRMLEAHAGSIWAVAVTADGKRAVSASSDRTLKVWDLESAEPIRTLEGHGIGVTAVAVTPDGSAAVSGSPDRTLKVWNLERGEMIHTLKGHAGSVWAVALTPDGKRAVSGSYDNTLRLWDLECAKAVRILEGHAGRVHSVAVTPDGKLAVSGSWDGTVKVWQLQTGEAIRTLEGHVSGVKAVAVTPDGRRIISGSDDLTLKVWDLTSGKEIATFYGDSAITSCAALPQKGAFLAGEISGRLHFLKLMNDDTAE